MDELGPEVRLLPVDMEASLVADSTGVPISVLECTRWVANRYANPLNMAAVRPIKRGFYVHAEESKRTVVDRRQVSTFAETHSWLDVGLQILCQVGWRPERPRSHVVNVSLALPSDGLAAHFPPWQTPVAEEESR